MLVPNQSIIFCSPDDLKWPVPSSQKLAPLIRNGTRSSEPSGSSVRHFVFLLHRWGGLHFVIGRRPHGTPNKTGDSYWTPFKLVVLTCFVGFQEPNLKAKRTPSMRIRHIQSLSSTRRSISTLTAIKYWFYRHCRDDAYLTTTTWCKNVWLGTQYHNFIKYLHLM